MLVFLVLALTALMAGCKKSSTDDPVTPTASRITEIRQYNNGVLNKAQKCYYTGALVNKIVYTDGSNNLYRKDTLIYNNSTIVSCITYGYPGGGVYKSSQYDYSNYTGLYPGLVMVHLFDQLGNETYTSRQEFTFYPPAGSRSIRKTYSYYNNAWIMVQLEYCAYTGNDLLGEDQLLLPTGEPSSRDTLIWNGSQVSRIIHSNYSSNTWTEKYKFEFSWSGSLCASETYSTVASGNWSFQYIRHFTYNGNGLLTRIDDSDGSQNEYHTDYIYESGAGNYYNYSIVRGGSDWFKGYPWPGPK